MYLFAYIFLWRLYMILTCVIPPHLYTVGIPSEQTRIKPVCDMQSDRSD